MLYCAAAENGYEDMAGHPIYDMDIKSQKSWMMLAIACIIAAYAKNNEEPPIDMSNIIYEATPGEISNMITTAIELRKEWYEIPKVLADKKPKRKDKDVEKN